MDFPRRSFLSAAGYVLAGGFCKLADVALATAAREPVLLPPSSRRRGTHGPESGSVRCRFTGHWETEGVPIYRGSSNDGRFMGLWHGQVEIIDFVEHELVPGRPWIGELVVDLSCPGESRPGLPHYNLDRGLMSWHAADVFDGGEWRFVMAMPGDICGFSRGPGDRASITFGPPR